MLKRGVVGVVGAVMALAVWAGPAGAATSGRQHFTIVTQGSGNNPVGTVVASGPITGVGKDVTTGEFTDKFVFPNGTVFVTHHPTGGSENFNPTTCVGTFTEQGSYQLTGGTKAYSGVSGNGTYTLRGVFVGVRTANGCSDQGATVTVVVRATGTTSGAPGCSPLDPRC